MARINSLIQILAKFKTKLDWAKKIQKDLISVSEIGESRWYTFSLLKKIQGGNNFTSLVHQLAQISGQSYDSKISKANMRKTS